MGPNDYFTILIVLGTVNLVFSVLALFRSN